MGAIKSGKNSGYYENQKSVTIRHKTQQAKKRQANLAKWVTKGVKKNGEPVLTMEQRKARLKHRHELRDERVIKAREQRAAWRATQSSAVNSYQPRRGGNNRRPRKEEGS